MDWDTEYKLKMFREEQDGLFDSNGERYTSTPIGKETSEMMLQLINELESALVRIETATNKLGLIFGMMGIAGIGASNAGRSMARALIEHEANIGTLVIENDPELHVNRMQDKMKVLIVGGLDHGKTTMADMAELNTSSLKERVQSIEDTFPNMHEPTPQPIEHLTDCKHNGIKQPKSSNRSISRKHKKKRIKNKKL